MIRINSTSRAAIFFAAVCLIPFLFPFVKGLSPFWGDLTYLQHPWRVFDSQRLMTGRAPLWNPYLYFGMPQMAAMQDGLFYPASILFDLFQFPTGLFFFHVFHYWLACFLAYLWVRKLGFSHESGLGAGILFGLNGILISREIFTNNLPILALLPALCLFALSPPLLAVTITCAFFSGHPEFIIGGILSAGLISLINQPKKSRFALVFVMGCILSIPLSGALLCPAAQLFFHSIRYAGIPQSEAWQFRFQFSDLRFWISPLFALNHHFSPAVDWWKCVYLGIIGSMTVLAGLFFLPRNKSVFLTLWIFLVILLTLAGSNPFSSWLWTHFIPLRFIRFPGNLTYLILIPATLAAAQGMERLPRLLRIPSWLPAILIATELSFYAFNAFPLLPRFFFAFKGPLVEFFQNDIGNNRYLLSPLALEKSSGQGFWDWKSRLYGLTNSPFQIPAAGNFGQPLVPKNNYALMDFLYGPQGLKNVTRIMPWADIQYLLTPSKIPHPSRLDYRGQIIWNLYETSLSKNLSRAYFLSPQEGARFPAGLVSPGSNIALNPLAVHALKEVDGYRISGNRRSGWVFISEPKYPGWEIGLKTDGKTKTIQSSPALTAFQKVQVPQGWSDLFLIYNSATVDGGIFVTTLSFIFLFLYAVFKMGQWTHENSPH